MITSEGDEEEMSHSDSESDEQRRQHGGAVVAGVHGRGVHHEHQEHGQQHLHDEAPSRGGVSVNRVHSQAPFLQRGEVEHGGPSDGSNGLGNNVNWKIFS